MEARRYKNKEFCKSVKCKKLVQNTIDKTHCYCEMHGGGCVKTAKEFHNWLNENNFCLLKCTMAKYPGV